MSRIAAVTRIPSALSSGLSMISIGNSLPSLRRADELDPGADLLGQRVGRGAQIVRDQPLGEALRDDVRDLLPDELVAAVAELLLGLDVEQDDLAAPGSPRPSRPAPPRAARGTSPRIPCSFRPWVASAHPPRGGILAAGCARISRPASLAAEVRGSQIDTSSVPTVGDGPVSLLRPLGILTRSRFTRAELLTRSKATSTTHRPAPPSHDRVMVSFRAINPAARSDRRSRRFYPERLPTAGTPLLASQSPVGG